MPVLSSICILQIFQKSKDEQEPLVNVFSLLFLGLAVVAFLTNLTQVNEKPLFMCVNILIKTSPDITQSCS